MQAEQIASSASVLASLSLIKNQLAGLARHWAHNNAHPKCGTTGEVA